MAQVTLRNLVKKFSEEVVAVETMLILKSKIKSSWC